MYERINDLIDCIIFFEGGSIERDNVPWMIDQKKTPINSVQDYTGYVVVEQKFPSLSMIGI
jgi:hypothetical protein